MLFRSCDRFDGQGTGVHPLSIRSRPAGSLGDWMVGAGCATCILIMNGSVSRCFSRCGICQGANSRRIPLSVSMSSPASCSLSFLRRAACLGVKVFVLR